MMMTMMMMTIMSTTTIVRITAFSSSSSSTITTINTINTDLGDSNRPILGAVASAAAAATIITPKSTTESTATIITIEERVDEILEYIDSNILLLNNKPSSSSSLSTKTNSILERIQNQHLDDYNTAKLSCLEIESNEEQEEGRRQSVLCSYESIPPPIEQQQQQQQHPSILAIKSTEPILDIDSVQAIRKAAEEIWDLKEEQESNNNNNNVDESATTSSSTSKFTYQYKGNSEAHVFDFDTSSTAGKKAILALNIALQSEMYPMIRDAFFLKNTHTNNNDTDIKLFVYDALVIRYNATAAAQADASGASIGGAGQPFHRDLGLVSINIMLNSNNEFYGGGTFFENQLLLPLATPSSSSSSTSTIEPKESIKPMKPNGIGYCIAHSASERHAGAGTINGVRDILVLFISAVTETETATVAVETASSKSKSKSNTRIGELYTSPLVQSTPKTDTDTDTDTDPVIHITPPSEILSARLKSCRSFCEQQEKNSPYDVLLCRILHLKLAVEYSSLIQSTTHQSLSYDGEAIQYLGTVLMEYADYLYHGRHDNDDKHSNDDNDTVLQIKDIYEVAFNCYQISKLLTPCDSRIYNNIGILLGKMNDIDIDIDSNDIDNTTRRNTQEREIAYKHGISILELSKDSGVKINNDLYSVSLNYGLFLANEDRYQDATMILESILIPNENENDAYRLWKFCKSRVE
jgi:sporulation protein YlmC with PRC-barrel domain